MPVEISTGSGSLSSNPAMVGLDVWYQEITFPPGTVVGESVCYYKPKCCAVGEEDSLGTLVTDPSAYDRTPGVPDPYSGLYNKEVVGWIVEYATVTIPGAYVRGVPIGEACQYTCPLLPSGAVSCFQTLTYRGSCLQYPYNNTFTDQLLPLYYRVCLKFGRDPSFGNPGWDASTSLRFLAGTEYWGSTPGRAWTCGTAADKVVWVRGDNPSGTPSFETVSGADVIGTATADPSDINWPIVQLALSQIRDPSGTVWTVTGVRSFICTAPGLYGATWSLDVFDPITATSDVFYVFGPYVCDTLSGSTHIAYAASSGSQFELSGTASGSMWDELNPFDCCGGSGSGGGPVGCTACSLIGHTGTLVIPDGPRAGTYTGTWSATIGAASAAISWTVGADTIVCICYNATYAGAIELGFGGGVGEYGSIVCGPPAVATFAGGIFGASSPVTVTT